MKQARHQELVRRCADEMAAWLPPLASRYSTFVLMSALAEQLSGALFLTQEMGVCTPTRAREIIERVKELALKGEPGS